jgi:hypothetical protein
MKEDESAEERAARAGLREMEEAAAELVELGDLLFGRGKPSDPALMRRYQLYRRVKVALALPMGSQRIAALRAAKIAPGRKH